MMAVSFALTNDSAKRASHSPVGIRLFCTDVFIEALGNPCKPRPSRGENSEPLIATGARPMEQYFKLCAACPSITSPLSSCLSACLPCSSIRKWTKLDSSSIVHEMRHSRIRWSSSHAPTSSATSSDRAPPRTSWPCNYTAWKVCQATIVTILLSSLACIFE